MMTSADTLQQDPLRVVVMREPDGRYCAEGVDFFVHGYGRTIDEAIEAMARDYRIHLILGKHQTVSNLARLRRDDAALLKFWRSAEEAGSIESRPMPRGGGSGATVSRLLVVSRSDAA